MRYRARTRNLFSAGAPVGPMRRDDPHDGSTGTAGGGGGGGGDQGATGDAGGGDGSDGGKPTDDSTGTGKAPAFAGDYDADRAARALRASRDAEAKAKKRAQDAEAKQHADRDAIAVALGLKPDPKQDPGELAKQAAAERDQARTEARTRAVELAVYRTAGKAGADADALLDSRTFLGQLADLDPDAADFADKVGAAIRTAVEANPKLAAAPAGTGTPGSQGPARQGTDHTGNGGNNQPRPRSIQEALTRARRQQ